MSFQVPEDVLKLVLSGESLSIVGNDSDAVICTKDKTYSVKRVEYSNSGKYFEYQFLWLCL